MEHCSNCTNPRRSKSQRLCKECHAAAMRESRKKHRHLSPEARQRANCRAYLKVYIRRGKVTKRNRCAIYGCKRRKIEAHHRNYKKPLDVVWLCRLHHVELTVYGRTLTEPRHTTVTLKRGVPK